MPCHAFRPFAATSRRWRPWQLALACAALPYLGACGASGLGGGDAAATAAADAARTATGGGAATDGASDANNGAGAAGTVATTASSIPSVAVAGSTEGARSDGPRVAADANGYFVVPLSGCVNGEYFANMVLGNANFNVLVDSGSSTMAVASSRCSNCGAADAYDVSWGTNLRRTASSKYGDGSAWSAAIYRDGVNLSAAGGTWTPTVALNFGAITTQTGFFNRLASCSSRSKSDFDGILGLGGDALLYPGATSLLSALHGAGLIAQDAFALQTCHVGGTLTLGGYDDAVVAERPVFFPLMGGAFANGTRHDVYYTLDLRRVALGNQELQVAHNALGSTIIDNGTNFSSVGPGLYKALSAALSRDANFTANFSAMYGGPYEGTIDYERSALGLDANQLDAALPPLVLTFAQAGGAEASVTLPATQSYLVPERDPDSGDVIYAQAILDNGDDEDVAGGRMLGNSLMRAHTIIFDRAAGQVGFAARGAGCSGAVPDYQP